MIATWTVLDLLCKLAYGLGAHGRGTLSAQRQRPELVQPHQCRAVRGGWRGLAAQRQSGVTLTKYTLGRTDPVDCH